MKNCGNCIMSYVEYLEKTGLKNCRESWIDWKIDIYSMSRKEAVKASIDPEWGYLAIITKG